MKITKEELMNALRRTIRAWEDEFTQGDGVQEKDEQLYHHVCRIAGIEPKNTEAVR